MLHRRLDTDPVRHVLVFETGDELSQGLADYARSEGILGASFTGVGAFAEVELVWFDWEAKEYRTSVQLDEQVELISLIGDVAENDGEPAVHAHLTIARSDGSAHGGHLKRAIVRPTCEIVLTETPEPLRKRHDPESGLALIRF
ncbi:MAG: DNA-binding protein [Actinomycetales bacterium]|nr:DNA-binding protein [Actinomycetales bacterium]